MRGIFSPVNTVRKRECPCCSSCSSSKREIECGLHFTLWTIKTFTKEECHLFLIADRIQGGISVLYSGDAEGFLDHHMQEEVAWDFWTWLPSSSLWKILQTFLTLRWETKHHYPHLVHKCEGPWFWARSLPRAQTELENIILGIISEQVPGPLVSYVRHCMAVGALSGGSQLLLGSEILR